MSQDNKPRRRERNVVDGTAKAERKGEGLGTGRVGTDKGLSFWQRLFKKGSDKNDKD